MPKLRKHWEDFHAGLFHYDEDGNRVDHYDNPKPIPAEWSPLFDESKKS